ncbi:MAG: hypothetical protein U9R75_06315, partial [Candidatus Thermoplasmatota archaeon]|nr:hypothetical protein [Candidatus Thermoplasmatota archaeon]
MVVRLYIDSATYLKQKDFIYDEGNGASKTYSPLEYQAQGIPPGTEFTATFPELEIFDMLPPGDYRIPIDYWANYLDPFDSSGAETKLYTYQWDERGIQDYMEIMWYK